MTAEIIVIGASLGGFQALTTVLGGLSASLPAPVLLVQHRSPHSGDPLKSALQKTTVLKLREAQDKETPRSGHVYLAPADYHLLVDREGLALSTDAPVNSARPSVDVLFETAAEAFGEHVVAVVLTGAGRDGARGVSAIKRRGGTVIVQDPETAEAEAMPRAAIAAARVDHVVPLSEVAALIRRCCAQTDA